MPTMTYSEWRTRANDYLRPLWPRCEEWVFAQVLTHLRNTPQGLTLWHIARHNRFWNKP